MPEPSVAASLMGRLLDLLAEGAPAEDLGAVIAEARTAGVTPAELAEVERAAATALRIRAQATELHDGHGIEAEVLT
ncbi:diguanylate phosphodiesterase, partial [Streptomyces sp. NPDC048301]